ncbi:MAG: hypothetical protein ACKOA8_18030 [Deltaproteobacteria bacterium]
MEDTSPSNHPPKGKIATDFALSKLEWLLTQWDVVRFWFTRAWRIGLLMAKGGYLLSERKKLFKRLGEETYYRIQKGDLSLSELLPLTQEINDLTKKIEIEELLIRRLRFGTSFRRKLNSENNSGEPSPMS